MGIFLPKASTLVKKPVGARILFCLNYREWLLRDFLKIARREIK
jgi:hypothetical protein